MQYRLELPFAPFNGLLLNNDKIETIRVNSTLWNTDIKEFTCILPHERPTNTENSLSYKDIINESTQAGWSLADSETNYGFFDKSNLH